MERLYGSTNKGTIRRASPKGISIASSYPSLLHCHIILHIALLFDLLCNLIFDGLGGAILRRLTMLTIFSTITTLVIKWFILQYHGKRYIKRNCWLVLTWPLSCSIEWNRVCNQDKGVVWDFSRISRQYRWYISQVFWNLKLMLSSIVYGNCIRRRVRKDNM